MNNKEQVFSIQDAISFAWVKVKEQLWFFIGFTALIIALQIINGLIQKLYENSEPVFFIVFLSMVVSFVIGLFISLFQIRIALDVADGKKAKVDSIKQVVPLLGKAIVTYLMYSLILVIGFLLFIIPGFIWSIKYQYALYFVVDKGMSPFEALEASGRITKGEKWHLFFLNLVLGLVMLAGFIAFGVGVFIALPIVLVAPGYVFRKLQKRGSKAAVSSERLHANA